MRINEGRSSASPQTRLYFSFAFTFISSNTIGLLSMSTFLFFLAMRKNVDIWNQLLKESRILLSIRTSLEMLAIRVLLGRKWPTWNCLLLIGIVIYCIMLPRVKCLAEYLCCLFVNKQKAKYIISPLMFSSSYIIMSSGISWFKYPVTALHLEMKYYWNTHVGICSSGRYSLQLHKLQ